MDPQGVYDEVLEEEREKGASDEAASARAEAAAERARLGSPHPKEAKFWVSERAPGSPRHTAVETGTTSEPVEGADVDQDPNPPDPGVRSDQDIAPGVSSQPATEARPDTREEPTTAEEGARRPTSQLLQAEEKPDDDQALQSQWDSQSRIGERERLMAERRSEAVGLIDTGVPMVTAAEGSRQASPLVLALYVLVPLAAILIFVLGLSSGGSESSTASTGAAQPQNTLTDITVSAAHVAFDTKTITAAAGKQITVHFDNKDTVTHNIAFYTDKSTKRKIYVGGNVTAGATADYSFKSPPKPGSYFFRCDIHPTSMFGTFVVKK